MTGICESGHCASVRPDWAFFAIWATFQTPFSVIFEIGPKSFILCSKILWTL